MKKVVLILTVFLIGLNINVLANTSGIRYSSLVNTDSIRVDIQNNEIKLVTKKGNESDLEIDNFSEYQDKFITNDDNTYPLYIIKNNNKYSFSETKANGSNIFMLSSKVSSILFNDASTNIANCETMLGVKFINLLKNNVFKIIYIIIPILLIVFSSYDFAVLVFSDNKDGIKGGFKKLTRRVIASVLIFFIPNILILLTGILGTYEIRTCVDTFKNTENIEEVENIEEIN